MIKLKINIKSVDKEFDRLAKELFNNYLLIVNQEEYLLTEIEFYLFNKQFHPDPFVHKNERQLSNGKWYFHGSGIDITGGNESEKIYFGILLRGIKKLNPEIFIDGPLNLIREIFDNFTNINDNQSRIYLAHKKLEKRTIFKSMRIGLNPKNKVEGIKYCNKKYRYITDLIIPHKYKNKEEVEKYKEKLIYG